MHDHPRLRRLTRNGSWIMVPMDHGISMGPLPGISPMEPTLEDITGIASCVTLHRGNVHRLTPQATEMGILMHLSASTDAAPDPEAKVLVANVEDALRAGCDGVSIHINVGSRTEAMQIRDAGVIASQCSEWNMPLVVMAYPRGPSVPNPAPGPLVAHAARLAAELGADAVKVPYTGDPESFAEVVDGAGIPVIVAGGPERDFPSLLQSMQQARAAGAKGISVGRNVFSSHDPRENLEQLARIFA